MLLYVSETISHKNINPNYLPPQNKQNCRHPSCCFLKKLTSFILYFDTKTIRTILLNTLHGITWKTKHGTYLILEQALTQALVAPPKVYPY